MTEWLHQYTTPHQSYINLNKSASRLRKETNKKQDLETSCNLIIEFGNGEILISNTMMVTT
jgi:hypothetical protein